MQKDNRSTRAARHCCVKGCPNPPAKGRKTCGKHGKTSAARHKTKSIHLDRVLRTWRDYETDTDPLGLAIEVTRLTEETPYIAGVAIRNNGAMLGLPTTREGFKALLADWLARPGRSLAEIELLTPGHLPNRDLGMAICNSAARLVAHDLSLEVRS